APTYTFKHALTREAAYQSLLASTRRQLHQRITQVLEAQFAGLVETQPEVLAHHYRQSGSTEKAVLYLQRAGTQALQRAAYAEAISHVTAAVELLKTLPDTVERAQRELVLQITLGRAIADTKAHGAPEVGQAYARARELCQHLGEIPQLFPVLGVLGEFYLQRGKYQTAHELAEQLFGLAQRQHDPAYLVNGHKRLGQSSFHLGALSAARTHLEQAIALHCPQQSPMVDLSGGRDYDVYARSIV